MIKSMTGFAALTREDDRATVSVTIRSVNHRHLDLQLRSPQSLSSIEGELRALVARHVTRGRVELSVSLQFRQLPGVEVDFNEDFARALEIALAKARERGLVAGVLTPGDLLRLPQAITIRDRQPDDDDAARAALAAQALLRWYGTADAKSLPDVVADTLTDFRDLQRRAGGNPLGNADLIYVNSGDDAALNAGVRRYRADAQAAAWLARWYTPSGKLTRPLLAVHDIGDPLVPAAGAFTYALTVQRAGHADNFVQQYVAHEGHCVFTPDEVARAFDQLVDWVDAGKRPLSGRLP